jgi:hypothetical protein
MTRPQNAIAAVQEFIRREEKEARKRRRGSRPRASAGAAGAGASKRKRSAAAEVAPVEVALVEVAPAVAAPEVAAPEDKVAPAVAAPEDNVAPAVAAPEDNVAPAVAAILAGAPAENAANAQAAIPATAQVFRVPVSALSPLELIAFDVLNSQVPAAPLNANHITNPAMSRFKRISNGGGNFKSTRISSREVEVTLNKDNLAMWPLKEYYQKKINAVAEFLQRPEVEKEVEGLQHPILRISCARMKAEVRQELVEKVYGYVKDPEQRFRQLLCTIGMRSKAVQGIYTWEFDPESWNRASYRLMPGCDSKGKPRVTFV